MISKPHSRINYFFMYALLFVCIFTSNQWTGWLAEQWTGHGELIRLDRLLIFDQINIFHIFVVIYFLIMFYFKVAPKSKLNIFGDRNYLKTIFIIYFIPVNILIYITIYIKGIKLIDLGIAPIVTFFTYIVITYYFQDIVFGKASRSQLIRALKVLEILIIFRCAYSIIKYFLGYGGVDISLGTVRLGAENDFADFFILLFIIGLTCLLFEINENKRDRILHIVAIIFSSYVVIFSFRRYAWIEWIIAAGSISSIYIFKNLNIYKIIILPSFLLVFITGSLLVFGPDKVVDNKYFGRLLSSLSIINKRYETVYGIETGHVDEILDGWYNVKKNWILGLTPFGHKKMRRFNTGRWQEGLYVHNAYLHIWILYGLVGFILFLLLYILSLKLGFNVFFKLKDPLGLILMTFIICQLFKNIVWATAIYFTNTTIVYIFIISIILQVKRCHQDKDCSNMLI